VTAIAIIVILRVRVTSLEWHAEYPVLSLGEPTRDLFVFVERERRLALARTWRLLPEQTCNACTEEAAAERFEALFAEQRRYVAAGYRRHKGVQWLREANAARAIALAGWGNPVRLGELRTLPIGDLPDYLSDRASEILRGDSTREWRRIARVGAAHNALGLLSAAIGLLGIGVCVAWLRGYRYPRREYRARLIAPTLGRGLLIFVWAQAFVSACARLRQEYPDTPLDLFGLLRGLALVIGIVALLKTTKSRLEEKPIEDLVRCPPDKRSQRALWLVGIAPLGGVIVFRFVASTVADRFGITADWSEGFNEKLAFGTPTEAALRTLSSLVLAPFGEEMAYRGVLFGALATRVRTHRAALVSAILFAVMHGYGVLGFSSVALGGYLRARISARTGTLLPAILGHALNNALAVGWELTVR